MEFVANLLQSLLVKKKFENRIIIGEVMAKSLVSFFLTHREQEQLDKRIVSVARYFKKCEGYEIYSD